MKKIPLILITFIIILSGCNTYTNISISEISKKGFLLTKYESEYIAKQNTNSKKYSDSCTKYKLNCYVDGGFEETAFPGGLNVFRQKFWENIKKGKKQKKGNYLIMIVIGKDNKTKSVEVLNYNDMALTQKIKQVLNLPELNRWRSGSYGDKKLEYYLEFNLNIK